MIEFAASLPSTNSELARRLASGEGVAEGRWLVADRQTAGRGRLGREWSDGNGNFMGSTVVAVKDGDPPAATLALVAGISLSRVIEPLVPPPHRALLKWPNDLLVGTAKLAGILLERVNAHVVVGIGVNLRAAPDITDRPAACLAQFGPAPDRDLFAADLAAAFAEDVARWRAFGLGPVVTRWLTAAHPVGTPLVAGEPGGTAVQGTFAGLSGDGALLLDVSDGTRRTIHAGDVNLAG